MNSASVRRTEESWGETLRIVEGHHHGLRDCLTAFSDAVFLCLRRRDAGSAQAVRDALAHLRDHADLHFVAEETFMEDVGYYERAAHIERHQEFLDWVRRLEETAAVEVRRLGWENVPSAMAAWWEAHVHGCDRRFLEFLCRGGI